MPTPSDFQFDQQTASQPRFGQHYRRAIEAHAANDLPGALKWISLAVKHGGNSDANVQHTHGVILRYLHRVADAAAAFEAALRLDTSKHVARFGLGECLVTLQQYEDAIPVLEPLLTTPLGSKALNSLAICFLQTGYVLKAIEHFELACAANPRSPAFRALISLSQNIGQAIRLAGPEDDVSLIISKLESI